MTRNPSPGHTDESPAPSGCQNQGMNQVGSASCEFRTERLRVVPWHATAGSSDFDLAGVVAKILTARSTMALPEPWQGDFSIARATAWIEERDHESPTLLVTEAESGRPVGLVILADVPLEESTVDVRIGYLLAEDVWGRGLATELVAGLANWAQTQPKVRTLTGGVDTTNPASSKVLIKNGFERIADDGRGGSIYQLRIEQDNSWDKYARSWDQDDAARAYATAAFSSLQEVVKSFSVALAGAQVIDFGCGTGLLTEQLVSAGAAVYAVDTSPGMLDVLDGKVAQNRWTNVRTGAELPVTARVYDMIVCSSVCSFLDDYPGTVTDLASLLRPGGIFVQWDWERTSDDDPHGLTRDEINSALERAGLVGVSVNTGFSASVEDQTMSPLMGRGRRPNNLTPDPPTPRRAVPRTPGQGDA